MPKYQDGVLFSLSVKRFSVLFFEGSDISKLCHLSDAKSQAQFFHSQQR